MKFQFLLVFFSDHTGLYHNRNAFYFQSHQKLLFLNFEELREYPSSALTYDLSGAVFIFAVGFRRDLYNVIFTLCYPLPEEFFLKVSRIGVSFRTGADLISFSAL